MIRIYTIFDTATGAVVSIIRVTNPDDATLNTGPDQTLVEGEYPVNEWRLVSGVPVEMPPRPAPYFIFDYSEGEWIDPRTPEDYDNYVADVRLSRKMSKIEFTRALIPGGAFSNDDIVDLAVGYFPQSVRSALSDLTPDEIRDLQLDWISSPNVGRLDSIVTHVAGAFGTSDSDLDLLFNITLYPPPEGYYDSEPEPSEGM